MIANDQYAGAETTVSNYGVTLLHVARSMWAVSRNWEVNTRRNFVDVPEDESPGWGSAMSKDDDDEDDPQRTKKLSSAIKRVYQDPWGQRPRVAVCADLLDVPTVEL